MLDILILFVYGFLHLPAEETDYASSNISIISSRSCSTVFMPLLRPQLTRLAFPWAMLSATQNFMSCCQIKSTVMAGLPFRDHLLVCNFHFPPTPHSIAHSYSDSPGTYTCTSTTETQIAYVLACLLLLKILTRHDTPSYAANPAWVTLAQQSARATLHRKCKYSKTSF